MKRVRLLPIVICATAALLVFKTIGIVTNGGYVLSGITIAQASGASGGAGGAEGAAPVGANGEITIPPEPTMSDTSPTIADPAPTLGEKPDAAGGHGEAPAAGHGEAAAEPAPAHGEAPAEGDAAAAGTPSAAGDATHVAEATPPDATAPAAVAAAPPADCPVEIDAGAAPGAAGHGAASPADGAAPHEVNCLTLKDAEAVREDGEGNLVPLTSEEGAQVTEKALLARLSDRRTELDALQTELDMRSALVDAAEKRLEERAAAVSSMEAQINALVAEKKALDDEQLKSIVGMYETMKPKEAASVFNTLDMDVLLKVARTMNPRKMAPIMAKMETKRAEELTVRLAAVEPEPTVAQATPTGQDLTALPQIVGQ